MSRRPNTVPTYRLHKPSGQAVVTLQLPNGARRDVYLGVYDSPESRQEYARLLQEIAVSPLPDSTAPEHVARRDLTVNELLLAFHEHAKRHYRHPDGRPTSEIHNWNQVVLVTGDLYGDALVREFGPLSLKAIRQCLIDSGLCRKVVIPNNRILRWEEETGAATVFRKPAHNSNGNTRDRQGRLVTCEHYARRVTRTEYDGSITVIADKFDGKWLSVASP